MIENAFCVVERDHERAPFSLASTIGVVALGLLYEVKRPRAPLKAVAERVSFRPMVFADTTGS